MNRIFPSLFFLITFYSHAYTQQSCPIIIRTDPVSQVKKAETGVTTIGQENDNLYCSAFRSGGDFGIYFGIEIWNRTICFKSGAQATVIFTDLSRLQVTNEQSGNCIGNFFITGHYGTSKTGDKSAIFDAFGAKIIKAIRFYTSEGFIDYDVAEENDTENWRNAEVFRNSLLCLKSAL